MTLKLSEMEKRCEELPEREWRAGRPDMLSYDGDGYGPYKQVYMDNPRGRMHLGERLPDVVARGEGKNCVAIAEFIADAKNNYPALIAWAKRARARLLRDLSELKGSEERWDKGISSPKVREKMLAEIRAQIAELEQLLEEVEE